MDGVYYAVKQAAHVMKAQDSSGSIIVTASILSVMVGSRFVEYSASKGGVLSVVQSAAAALASWKLGSRARDVRSGLQLFNPNQRFVHWCPEGSRWWVC